MWREGADCKDTCALKEGSKEGKGPWSRAKRGGQHGGGVQDMDLQRWHPNFDAEGGAVRLRQTLWRKSSQWFALSRSHAELVINDTEVEAIFKGGCYSRDYDEVIRSYVALPFRPCSPSPLGSGVFIHCFF